MPTRTQYINYVHSRIGHYGVGRAENDVDQNRKYYGRRVSGPDYAWCLVEEWVCMDHFGIATRNGGKAAYVPNMPGIAHRVGAKVWSRPKRGSAAYQPGNRIGFDFNKTGEAEHTGTFWKVRDSSTFYSIDGNTGDDEVAERIRRYSDVLFVVETLGLDGPAMPGEKGKADVPDYVSLTTKTSITVKPDQQFFVQFDKEITDKAKRSADTKPTPGIFTAGKNGSVYACNVDFAGPAVWELCEMRKDSDGSWKQHDHNVSGNVDLMDADGHLWLRVTPHAAGEVTVTVKCAIWDR